MAEAATGVDMGHALALLGAGVVAVPLFRRMGLGSVLGYLVAGLAIGPFGLRLFDEPETLMHIAELGVVMFLFIIGLEMRPSRLWSLRRSIFGLGAAQVLCCGAVLSVATMLAGFPPAVAVVGAMGFVLSSTAVIMQMLEERGETATTAGQRAISILLLEDLAIVPLLAMVAVWGALVTGAEGQSPVLAVLMGIAAIAAVVAAGLWLLDPMFRILARSGAREVMTAAALLVVLGAAVVMQAGGLSMAMGAFLAGVLLSESNFRHQLEADIEPFRGILLGLFFLSVGMSLDIGLVVDAWPLVVGGVALFMLLKAGTIFAVARVAGNDRAEAIERAALFAQGGEFAFVLYAAAVGAGLLAAGEAAVLSAIVILSMALTPVVLLATTRLMPRPAPSLDGIDVAADLHARVLVIGFGRFAQVVTQPLLARGIDLTVIENDVEMIQAAGKFGFKVYYGDGGRLDVLRASGAERAEAILVCVDRADVADHIVALCRAEFPIAKLFVRAFDRGHVLRLIEAKVDYQIRETFESAIAFGRAILVELGVDERVADETMIDVRRRDEERLELQLVGGITAGRQLIRRNTPTPEPAPLTPPKRRGVALNEEAAEAIER
ncbi:glutathione-regulated potassium-efflux system protein KefB [Sphingomonas jejuensis]|uniref:Glutathione-regulated potassium-efflux system protein KefB n=1 Tax=Sphingomonas jejuensis TaxID=904715 RepID=A0ABX0XLN3_9SPHN|nr:monovalent cation:proton antiporter-2 (CPA2) family protein [Sphingomonas jejuensis]NJC33676.1 glutathione-regulated potassium-efflux system protein KefB [Sphingomonas jejuensis]